LDEASPRGRKPEIIFSVIKNFRDCLSRQVAEAIKIHYSRDELLNSKNEYNANCLTRIVVEEEVYERKKRERKEEMEELEEKKRWEVFKIAHRQQPKRQRPEEVSGLRGWMEGKGKKLRRMESVEEEFEMAGWWEMMEGRCVRAGNLKRRLENDRERVLKRMENRNEDALMESLGARHPSKNTPNSQALGWHSDFEIVNDGVGARYPIITPNTQVPDQFSSTSGLIGCDTGSGIVKATHLQKSETKFRNNLKETRRLSGRGYMAGPDGELEPKYVETTDMAVFLEYMKQGEIVPNQN
jgi:hypothetical protein